FGPARPEGRAAGHQRRARGAEGGHPQGTGRLELAAVPGPLHAQPVVSGPKDAKQMVAAFVRTIFAQPDKAAAHAQLANVADSLGQPFPKAAEVLREAEEDIRARMAFPREHWRQLHSTNPLERLMREIGRRTDVVGIFPNRVALIRLAGAVLVEQQDEWIAAPRRYFSQESMNKLYRSEEQLGTRELPGVPER